MKQGQLRDERLDYLGKGMRIYKIEEGFVRLCTVAEELNAEANSVAELKAEPSADLIEYLDGTELKKTRRIN